LLSGLAATMIDKTAGASPGLDNPDIPAGYTFLGQFLDHDITLDTTPLDEQRRDPKALVQSRTPRPDRARTGAVRDADVLRFAEAL
jgi:hypothetical protein